MTIKTTALWLGSLVVVAAVAVGATAAIAGNDDSSEKALGDPMSANSVASGSSATTPESTSGSTDDTPKWLFSEVAGGGTFATAADGTHTLTLTDLDPQVTAFTDRPARDAAIMPVELMFNSWEQMFHDSPPNAVLVEHDPAGDVDSYVVELTNPKWDGTTASFTAAIVHDTNEPDRVPGTTPSAGQSPPAIFDAVSLFIDDVEYGDTLQCMNRWYTPNYQLSPPGSIVNPMPGGDYRILERFSNACLGAGGIVVRDD